MFAVGAIQNWCLNSGSDRVGLFVPPPSANSIERLVLPICDFELSTLSSLSEHRYKAIIWDVPGGFDWSAELRRLAFQP